MDAEKGHFVISLDFEIMWGVRDVVTLQSYGEHLRGVQQVIPKTLSLFKRFNIRGTFATVGLLFFDTKQEMLANLPALLPAYERKNLSPYGDYMQSEVGEDAKKDKYHFAPNLIQQIADAAGHEIGTHTFSHYYCLEAGQTIRTFEEDLKKAIEVAEKKGIPITSIVFPRNQYNAAYINICKELGILAYRNNERSWIYRATSSGEDNILRRAIRFADAYLNLTGYHCYPSSSLAAPFPVNIPSSRFLRPYSPKLKRLDKLRLQRIKNAMTYAARNQRVFHLWWHPHNFGIHQDENFNFLEKILMHYKYLNEQYGFKSITMTGLAKDLSVGNEG